MKLEIESFNKPQTFREIIRENTDIQLIFEILGVSLMLVGIIVIGLSF